MQKIAPIPGVSLPRLIYGIWRPGGSRFTSTQPALHDPLGRMGAAWSLIATIWPLRQPARFLSVTGNTSLARIRTLFDAVAVDMDRSAWFTLYTRASGMTCPDA
jgi:predicted oxidoreductase